MVHFRGLYKMQTMKLHQSGVTLSLHSATWHSMVSCHLPFSCRNLRSWRFVPWLVLSYFRSKCERNDQWRCPLGASSDLTGLFSRGHKESSPPNSKFQPHIQSWNAAATDRVLISGLGLFQLFPRCLYSADGGKFALACCTGFSAKNPMSLHWASSNPHNFCFHGKRSVCRTQSMFHSLFAELANPVSICCVC